MTGQLGPQVRPPVERETIRVGVIGAGFGAMVHIPALREIPGIEIVAVCSARLDHAREVATKYQIPEACDDYRELLVSRNVDAVTVAVPPFLHHPVVLAACEAGIHVLCEKPLARTAAEARDMARMAHDAGICHAVAFHRRYEPARMRMKQLVDEGFIGDLHSVSVIVYRSTLGPSERRPFTWMMERDKGGGVLAAVGSHYVDQLRWWFGDAHAVSGTVSTAVRERPSTTSNVYYEVDADDNTSFVMQFASGALGSVAISYTAPTDVGEEIVASGSEGILAIQEPGQLVGARAGDQIRSVLPRHAPRPTGKRRHIDPFRALATGWVEAMRSGRPATPSFDDGARVQEVLDAVTQSQRLKRWIDLSGEKWPV